MENLRVNSFRIKLLVLLMSLAMLMGVVFNFNRTAVTNNVNAVSFDDTTSYVSVGELYDVDTQSINIENYKVLLKYITGSSVATITDAETLASAVTDASEMRAFTLDAGSEGEVDYLAKTNSQDIIVRLGGLDWQVMYLSQDKSGNAILTLWLDNNKQDAWADRSATEGKFYGFIDGALYSDWSYNWYNSATAVAYPSAMYGTSYINAVTLNNGGMYATSNTAVTTGVEKSVDNPFAVFTMEEYGLTEHIVTPRQVSWQENQSTKTIQGTSYNYPNDAWSNSTTGEGFYNVNDNGVSEYNYAYNTNTGAIREENDDWADSNIWLPSMAETGYSTSYTGLWKTSTNQRMNYDGSTTSSPGSVGSSSGTAYPYSWLRSGSSSNADYAYRLYPSGAYNNYYVSFSYAVRPSLHLNLNSVELSSTRVSIAGGSMSVSPTEEEFDGCVKTPTVAVILDGEPLVENTDYTLVYTLNGEEVDELWSAGEYTITAEGKGDYRGSLSTTYTINPTALVGITLSSTSETYNTASIIPAITVSSGHGLDALVDGDEFIITIKNGAGESITAPQMVDAGTYTIIATGVGNFTGEVSTTFTIKPLDINDAVYQGSCDSEKVYTGSEIEFFYGLTFFAEYEIQDADYEVVYTNNINVGTATCTISGINNLCGQIVFNCTITALDISSESITIDDIENQVYSGSELTPLPVIEYNGNELIKDIDYTLTYKDNENAGTATITISGKGNFTGNRDVEFHILPRDMGEGEMVLDYTSFVYTGVPIIPKVTVTVNGRVLTELIDYTVGITTVDGEDIDAINVGRYLIAANSCDNGNYDSGLELYFEITSKDISDESITVDDIEDQTYTGSDIIVLPNVKHNGITLVKDTDYTLSYTNNFNAGDSTITITGKGNFCSSRQVAFTINQRDISTGSISMVDTFIYYLDPVLLAETIRVNSKNLSLGTDYSIEYHQGSTTGTIIDIPVDAGTYYVVFVGKGNYTGNLSASLVISPLDIKSQYITIEDVQDEVYTGSEIKPIPVIALSGTTLSNSNYSLTYFDNINVSTNVARIYIEGKGNLTSSRTIYFNIVEADIANADIDAIADQTYTGSAITPEPILTYNGKSLVKDIDYKVSYSNNINVTSAGDASVVVTGIGNFTNTITKLFTINPLNISGGELIYDEVLTYTGLELIPNVTLKVDGKTLVKDTDYTIVASNNINVGTEASVSVTGKGNYTGTINSSFAITARSLSETDISSIPTQNYTGSEIKPIPNITYNTRPLTNGVDFDCTYENNINVGTATITIVCKGNFEGSDVVTFEIGSLVISSFTLGTTSFVYDTVEKFPSITVKYGTNILTQDKDYSVAGDISASNVGNYAITITGMGGYSGTKTLNWSITSRNLSDCTITLDEDVFTYTGLEHKPNVTIVTNIDEYVIGSDNYTLVYSDNIDAGTGKVTITGTGNLTGSLNKTFTIDARSMLEADVVVTVLGEQVYTGAEIQPELTITYNGMELTKDTDYTCSFNNNIDVTSGARILIVGQGNYTAIKVVEFEIKQRDIAECEVVLSSYNLEYNAEIQVVTVEVKYGETIISSDNYNVIEDSGTDVGEYPIIVYGTNNLKGENSSQTLIISPKQLEETWVEDIPNKLYMHDGDGNAIPVTLDENELVLSWDDLLVAGTDYTFELSNATTIYEDETFATPGNIPTVTITGKGNYTGTVSKYFIIYDNNILTDDKATVSIEFNTHTYTGVEIKPQVTVKWINNVLSENTDYRVEYSDNVNVGTATVKVVALGNYNGVVIKTFEITPKSLAGWTEGMMLGGAPYIYNGAEHKPTLTLTTNNGVDLILDTDYSCEYLNNIDAGEATIVVNGKGNYCDSAEIPFRIIPQEITIASIGDLAQSSYVYTGSAITPSIVVSYDNGNKVVTLEQDVDYTVSYMNNINVGEATIVATGKGNYSGEITKTFTICSEGLGTVLLDRNSFVYDTTSKIPVFSVELGDKVLVNGADYDASGDLSASEVGTYTITFTGKGNFSGELTAEWKITARPLEDCYITIVESDLEYTGKEIKPAITIKTAEDGVTISSDMYTLVYSENINVGTGKVVITGKDNLSGTITKTYEISERNINNAYLIIDDDNLIYTSEEIRPTVVVMFNDNTLVEGTDYDVCYENNINAGNEARVIVGGFGNYCGALQMFFTIKPQNISSANLTIENNTFVYTGSAIDTKAKLVASGVELQKDIDYNAELRLTSPTGNVVDEAKNVGNYYLVVTGIANYTGSKFVGFNIVKATPSVSVVCSDTNIFAGKPVHLAVTSSSTAGTIYCSQTTYIEGEYTYEYTFVPVDTDNYNVVVGTITLTATKLQVVGLVFSGDYKTEYVAYETLNTVDLVVSLKYNNNEIQELYLSEYTLSMRNGAILRVGDKVTVTYVNNHEIKADLPITISKREVVASCQQKLIDNGEPQEVILTFDNEVEGVPVTYSAVYYNLSTGMPINNIVNAGKYKAIITLTNENYVIEENEILFEVCAKTITSSDEALVIESADGFASDEVLTYDIETNENVVLEELGISKFKEDKEFVSVYSFDISEDKDVVVTLSLDIDNVESVIVYKLDNNVLVSLPYSVVGGNKISVSCNTADKLYVFKSLTYTINNDKVEFISAVVVLLAIIVVGLLLTMVIEGRNKAKLVNNKSGKSVSTEEIVVEQDNGIKEIQQEVSPEDALLAQYVITDNEGNVVGLKEGAPEELQKAFSELNAEIASENSVASAETIIEENAITQENAFVEESAPVEEKPIVEEHPIVEKVEEKQPVLSDEEMIAKYAIIDDNGNVIGVKEDAPEELRQTYSMLVNLKEAENTKKEQQLSDEEMIAKYAIIDENGNVVGLKEDAPEALKQSYNALLNKNDNN